MVDLGVALTWIAISAASVKGLSALARAAAAGDSEAELDLVAAEAGRRPGGMSAPELLAAETSYRLLAGHW